MGLCSEEEAAMLRQTYGKPAEVNGEPDTPADKTPDMTSDMTPAKTPDDQDEATTRSPELLPEGATAPIIREEVRFPAPGAREEVSARERSTPILRIDWGTDLRPGAHLTPEFTILGLPMQRVPLLYFPLDARIRCEGWDRMPALRRRNETWTFHQPLRLEEPGHYMLEMSVLDLTPGFSDPGFYRCTFRVLVSDPDKPGQQRTLEICSDGPLTANLNNLGNFDHVRVNTTQSTVLNASDQGGVLDRIQELFQAESTVRAGETDPNRVTNIPFLTETELLASIPYIAEQKTPTIPSQITLIQANRSPVRLICGDSLTFGRNVPEENCWNDIALEIIPGTKDDEGQTDAFALLGKFFSRDHARLEMVEGGVRLSDTRQSGIRDATILDEVPLPKNGDVLLFPNEGGPETGGVGGRRTVLFSKILAMEFEAFSENPASGVPGVDATLFPDAFLYRIYSIDPMRRITSVAIRRHRFLQQHRYAKSFGEALRKTPLADNARISRWLGENNYPDALFDRMEYRFIPAFATLGRSRGNTIRIADRQWEGVQLRVLNINKSLFVENLVSEKELLCRFEGREWKLPPLRPIPIRPGLEIRHADSALRFE